jgi:hypothetical protein
VAAVNSKVATFLVCAKDDRLLLLLLAVVLELELNCSCCASVFM